MVRDPKPGELRGVRILEKLEKMFKRPETRLDGQKILSKLSSDAQVLAKHLVVSGPASYLSIAKATGLKVEQIKSSSSEIEAALGLDDGGEPE